MDHPPVDSEWALGFVFDCPVHLTPIRRDGLPISDLFFLQTVTASVARPVVGEIFIESGFNALIINSGGAANIRLLPASAHVVIPRQTVIFLRGGAHLAVQVSRGDHSALIITWPTRSTPILEAWTSRRQAGPKHKQPRQLSFQAIRGEYACIVDRLRAAQESALEIVEPLMISVILELGSRMLAAPDGCELASIPEGLPDNLREVLNAVRQRPQQQWSLPDASTMAGYSPFHFSRVCKGALGYGFPDFVERCRTEMALRLLTGSHQNIDSISAECGFGATQAMRQAVKRYVGLVPSEIRQLPDLPLNL